MFKEENVAVRGLSSSGTGSSWTTHDCGRFVFLAGSGKSNRFLAVNDVIVGSINHFPGKLLSKAYGFFEKYLPSCHCPGSSSPPSTSALGLKCSEHILNFLGGGFLSTLRIKID